MRRVNKEDSSMDRNANEVEVYDLLHFYLSCMYMGDVLYR